MHAFIYIYIYIYIFLYTIHAVAHMEWKRTNHQQKKTHQREIGNSYFMLNLKRSKLFDRWVIITVSLKQATFNIFCYYQVPDKLTLYWGEEKCKGNRLLITSPKIITWTYIYMLQGNKKEKVKKCKNLTWTRKTFSGANRLMEVATEMVSRPEATTNKGPSLRIIKFKKKWFACISLKSLFLKTIQITITTRQQSSRRTCETFHGPLAQCCEHQLLRH